MKGMVFTEFLEMVEDRFGLEIVDEIIVETGLDAEYTAVGTYDHSELISLVVALSERLGVPVPDLVQAYGQHMLGQFAAAYPQFFEESHSTFDFLARIESYIHPEVRKLHPDAELPTFEHEHNGDTFRLTYNSSRPFADLAAGLVTAAAEHFGETITVERQDHEDDHEVYRTTFLLTKIAS